MGRVKRSAPKNAAEPTHFSTARPTVLAITRASRTSSTSWRSRSKTSRPRPELDRRSPRLAADRRANRIDQPRSDRRVLSKESAESHGKKRYDVRRRLRKTDGARVAGRARLRPSRQATWARSPTADQYRSRFQSSLTKNVGPWPTDNEPLNKPRAPRPSEAVYGESRKALAQLLTIPACYHISQSVQTL
jgi:hypothetical protein